MKLGLGVDAGFVSELGLWFGFGFGFWFGFGYEFGFGLGLGLVFGLWVRTHAGRRSLVESRPSDEHVGGHEMILWCVGWG